MVTCSILIPAFDIYFRGDENGCINKEGHWNEHVTVFPNGKIIKWKPDYCPNCESCTPEDSECFISTEISKLEALQLLTEEYQGAIPPEVLAILDQLI